MRIWVVIPAYNEASIIGRVIKDLKAGVENIVVVNDGSTDDTAMAATASGAVVISHMINLGQGAALQTGIDFALKNEADIIITFDGDGQHQVGDIENVIKPLILGEVDVVLGSRFLVSSSQVPTLRRLLLRFATLVTKIYTGLVVTDTHNGFRAFSKYAAEKIEIRQNGMAHASEIIEQIKRQNLKFKEVPITIRYTAYSLAKGQHLGDSFKIFWDLIIGRISR
ncbi:MAG: glycosyltransferase family 2 protein [Patescibacteria group bacterium]|nr:glycosyltransferase family 2 protein [Patescibacteria group bacterium]